jgi:hypothetical protein
MTRTYVLLVMVMLVNVACGGAGPSFEAGEPNAVAAGDAGAAPPVDPWGDAAVDFDALPEGCALVAGYGPSEHVAVCEAGVLPPGCSLESQCEQGLHCATSSAACAAPGCYVTTGFQGCVYGLAAAQPCGELSPHPVNEGCAARLRCVPTHDDPLVAGRCE